MEESLIRLAWRIPQCLACDGCTAHAAAYRQPGDSAAAAVRIAQAAACA